MAGRINTKLIVPLLVGLVVVAGGVIALGYYAIRRSPDYYRGKGDEAAALGDWRTAREFYSKAVNVDQGSIELIDLWLESIRNIVPEDETEWRLEFQWYNSLLKRRAEIRPLEPQYHIDWLTHLNELARPRLSLADAVALSTDAEAMLRNRPADATDARWEMGYRFRGIADAHRLADRSLAEDVRTRARADLDRALTTNPSDAEAASALITWHVLQAATLEEKGRASEGRAGLDEAVAFATEFAEKNPNDVSVRLSLSNLLRFRTRYRARGEAMDLAPAQAVTDEAERIALKTSPLPWWQAIELAEEVAGLDADPQRGLERSLALIEHALQSAPAQPRLLYERASYLARLRRHDEALDAYQALLNLANPPIGLASMQLFTLRPAAVLAQYDIHVDRWRAGDADDARTAALERLEAYRALASESDPNLPYMEARAALAERRPDVAAQKFTQFLAAGGDRVPRQQHLVTLLELAVSLRQTGQSGAAYDHLAEADALAGGGYAPIVAELTGLDVERRDLDAAERNLDRLRRLEPESSRTALLEQRLRLARGEAPDAETADPVSLAIYNARVAGAAGDLEEGRAELERALAAAPEEPRLLFELARFEQNLDRTDRALEYVRRGLTKDPHSERFLILEALLTQADLATALEAIVDRRPGLSDADRLIAKWRLLNQFGLAEEAERHYAEAVRLEPEHPALLELEFERALQAEDWAKAQTIVGRAVASDADLAGGLTFRGRLELARGDHAAAVGTLDLAKGLKPYDGAVWRFLGVAHREAGNYPAALDAFAQSLDRDPLDVTTLKEQARLQLAVQDHAGALETMRRARELARSDTTVQNLYLELEGRYGDRAQAVRIREDLHRRRPDDLTNAMALAELYAQEGDRQRASDLLASLDPNEPADRLRIAGGWARWHALGGDHEAGEKAYRDFLASDAAAENATKLRALLALAEYWMDAERPDRAVAAVEEARTYQDPTQRQADRWLGAHHAAAGDYDAALASLEPVLAADPKSATASLQVINLHFLRGSQLQAGDPARAGTHFRRVEELLAAHERAHGESVDTMLLRGGLATQRGQDEEAERLFNRAVGEHPQNRRVYVARAQFNLRMILERGATDRTRRLEADVDRAMELNSGDAEPLLILAELALRRTDPQTGAPAPDHESLARVYRRALTVNPRDDATRRNLVELLFRLRRFDEAMAAAQDGIEVDPTRPDWYELRGDLEKRRGGAPTVVADLYRQAFERDRSAPRLTKWIDALLALNPPATTEATRLLEEYAALIAVGPRLRVLEARLHAAGGDLDAARASLRTAKGQIDASTDPAQRPALVRAWFEGMMRVLPPTEFTTFSDSLFTDLADPWPQAFSGMGLAFNSEAAPPEARPALQEEGLARLRRARALLTESSAAAGMPTRPETTGLQRDVGWWLGNARYGRGEYADAVDAWRWALAAAPGDGSIANNLAFALAEHLNDPAAALEPARLAHASNPADPNILDTYGYVLFRNGRFDEAERMLRGSVALADQAAARKHLGQVLAAKGDTAGAREQWEQARTIAERSGDRSLAAEVEKMLEALPTG